MSSPWNIEIHKSKVLLVKLEAGSAVIMSEFPFAKCVSTERCERTFPLRFTLHLIYFISIFFLVIITLLLKQRNGKVEYCSLNFFF